MTVFIQPILTFLKFLGYTLATIMEGKATVNKLEFRDAGDWCSLWLPFLFFQLFHLHCSSIDQLRISPVCIPAYISDRNIVLADQLYADWNR